MCGRTALDALILSSVNEHITFLSDLHNQKMLPSVELLKMINSQSYIVFACTILFFFFLYKLLLTKNHHSKTKLPPSPPKLPILGNILQLGTYPHRSLNSLSQKYGEIMLIHIGQSPTFIISSAKAAREIMKTNDAIFCSRISTKTLRRLLYECKDVAGAPYGEYWRQMKSICVLQLLNTKRVSSFRVVREQEMTLLVEQIMKSASSSVDLSEMFMEMTCNVISRVTFGRIYVGIERGIDFKKLLMEIMEHLGRFRVGDFIPWLAWIDKISGWDAEVDKLAKEFDVFLERVVKEHQVRREQRSGDGSGNDEKSQDFVDVLLDFQENQTAGFPLETESIKAIILDMFFAGADTSYTVLEWAMTELLRHPTVMLELQQEVRGITGDKSNPNEDDIEQMKYLKAVIKETLRLRPPIPMLVPRLSIADAKVNGYDIPAGSVVMTNAWAIHRDPASWDEPERFNPKRFLSSSVDFKGQDFELIPFGAGRRICPGIMFATANIELVLANLIHKFDWSLPGGASAETLDTAECIGLTTHRKMPLLAVATPLDASK